MRLALSTAMLGLCLAALGAYADLSLYRNVVRVIDGDSLTIDLPDWPAPFESRQKRPEGVGGNAHLERPSGEVRPAWA
jgi:hypothetical protein